MSQEPDKIAKRSIWLRRGRRVATGVNVLVALVLASMALLFANVLSLQHFQRWDISTRDYYRLSDKTCGLIANLESPVSVVSFFQRSHALFDDVRNLLREYEYEAVDGIGAKLSVEMLDPDRDMARTRELAKECDVDKPNVIVVRSGSQTVQIAAKDLADYHYALDGGRSVTKKKVAFGGEQVVSSAIQSVVEAARPTVYFLAGHGERAPTNFGALNGYSGLSREMKRDNIEVRPLLLAETGGVPKDCSALVIAGPSRSLSATEVSLIAAYLEQHGRILLLLEPGHDTGLEPLLERWGVTFAADAVVGLTLTGRDLIVNAYGDHPVTEKLSGITTMFYGPRSVRVFHTGSANGEDVAEDKPQVTVLAQSSEQSWAEFDLTQQPAEFDEGVDELGPWPVAVALEKGPIGGIDVELIPTRLIVIGDADFVGNGALRTGVGGNLDFFLSSLNWLLEREALLAISPKTPGELRPDMSRRQWQFAYLIVLAGIPLLFGAVGLIVHFSRQQ